MAIKLLFEDYEDTPSSILLTNCTYGDNIYFSGGSSALFDKLHSIKGSNDTVYVFYDVSPNNNKTVIGYHNFVTTLKQYNIKDVYVIPIICIEYYICKMLKNINNLSPNNQDIALMMEYLIDTFDWQTLIESVQLIKYVMDSLEHAYKHILTQQKSRCTHNNFKYTDSSKTIRDKNNIMGKFYENDCNCDRKYCRTNTTLELKHKAELLYTLLPLYVVETDEHKDYLSKHNINVNKQGISEIRRDRQIFYNKICKSLNVNSIKII